jgi:ABC-type dipeptide/oligopeptide/nickel transport system permease component
MKMWRYIQRRLLLVIPVLIGVSLVVFMLTRMAGDPAAAYISDKHAGDPVYYEQVVHRLHLDEPYYVQYWYWLDALFQGDWGYSKTATMDVSEAIPYFFPATIELAMVAVLMAILIGIPLGMASAVRRNKPYDHATRVISLIGVSIPIFWLGLILLNIFSYQLGWFPNGNRYDLDFSLNNEVPNITGLVLVDSLLTGNIELFFNATWHLILPAVCLAFGSIAIIMRIMRNSMLEVLNLDYIKTARAKGVPEKDVIHKHARKNAMIPTTTVIGLAFGGLLAGAVLTESIFAWPGLGRWSAKAMISIDTAAIMGFCLLVAIIYLIVNLIVDLAYAWMDPRVRLG